MSPLGRTLFFTTATLVATLSLPAHAGSAPELVVDAAGGGDHRTIAEAVAAAPEGATIVVRAGRYDGEFTIERSLRLIADGDVTVEADAPVIWRAPEGELRGLRIIRNTVEGRGYGVLRIESGAPLIADNDLSGDYLGVFTLESRPRLIANRIHGSRFGGIFCSSCGAEIRDNETFDNAYSGIEISEGAEALVIGNFAHGNSTGIYVRDSNGRIERNLLTDNNGVGIQVRGDAQPLVRNNHLEDNTEAGIFVNEGAAPRVEHNLIAGSGYSGLDVATEASPLFAHNVIRASNESGTYVHDGGRPRLEDNLFVDTGLSGTFDGVFATEGSEVTVLRNRFFDTSGYAAEIADNSTGRLGGNLGRGREGRYAISDAAPDLERWLAENGDAGEFSPR